MDNNKLNEHANKFIKYYSLMIDYLKKGTKKDRILKHKKANILKNIINKYTIEHMNFNDKTKTEEYLGTDLVKHMYDFLRLCEEADIIVDQAHQIDVVSLNNGLDRSSTKDFYFLIKKDISLNIVWCTPGLDRAYFTDLLDHMFFHCNEFFGILGILEPYEDYIFKSVKNYTSVVKCKSKIIENAVKRKVDEYKNLKTDTPEYKKKVKKTVGGLVDVITDELEKSGSGSLEPTDLMNLIADKKFEKISKNVKKKFEKDKVMFDRSQTVDGLGALFDTVDTKNIANNEVNMALATMVNAIKNNKNPQIKNDGDIQRLLKSLGDKFKMPKGAKMDPGMLDKLKKMGNKQKYQIIRKKK